ncbi:MAG: type II toxin-antitoxin system VapC family toxin [Pseudomonadota bacterium]|nr:type II toxin-antitoxin system VapC family toxin [Pseudomonadota bacterium]
MILVDTSVWIDHLRRGDKMLARLLEHNRVGMHAMVLGELACGNLRNRPQLIKLWDDLEFLPEASHHEAMYFLEKHRLMGKGIGYIDVHLLASATLATGAKLWTRDKRLASIAEELGSAWPV